MECGLAEEQVEKSGIVCLDNKEEDFLCRDPKERGPNDGVGRISPYPIVNQVRIPRSCGDDSDLDTVSCNSNEAAQLKSIL